MTRWCSSVGSVTASRAAWISPGWRRASARTVGCGWPRCRSGSRGAGGRPAGGVPAAAALAARRAGVEGEVQHRAAAAREERPAGGVRCDLGGHQARPSRLAWRSAAAAWRASDGGGVRGLDVGDERRAGVPARASGGRRGRAGGCRWPSAAGCRRGAASSRRGPRRAPGRCGRPAGLGRGREVPGLPGVRARRPRRAGRRRGGRAPAGGAAARETGRLRHGPVELLGPGRRLAEVDAGGRGAASAGAGATGGRCSARRSR
jgi:hypothetical protein